MFTILNFQILNKERFQIEKECVEAVDIIPILVHELKEEQNSIPERTIQHQKYLLGCIMILIMIILA